MSNLSSEAQFDLIRKVLEPLMRERAELARRRDEAAKEASRHGTDWKRLQSQWAENKRRGPIPPWPKAADDPYGPGSDWWREQA